MSARPPFFCTPLSVIAVALPFLFCVTQAPTANFWPLLVSWMCGAVLLAVAAAEGQGQPLHAPREVWAKRLALGLALAAAVGCAIGLMQYAVGDPGLAPFVHPSAPGQAVGNLRQRNQQASLLSLGVWALLWCLLHGERWWGARQSLVRVALTAVLVWMALASAATASRTGALQWVLILAQVLCWRRSGPGNAVRPALALVLVFCAASWGLPEMLWRVEGVRADALFHRFAGESRSCTGRTVLWLNMLTLIAQKPWLGWGWGELDYAHYITLFPGERFCVLLDNAHNLPLHLAVELGLPAAVSVCCAVGVWVLQSRPWRETRPERQLAWGVLAIIGLHSMLEYPLWYGPFQIAALFALVLLAWPSANVRWGGVSLRRVLGVGALLVGVVCAGAAWDYFRVSQLYKAPADRAAAYRDDVHAKVTRSVWFTHPLEFAQLTTTPLTRGNAQRMNRMAKDLLHYSPEPRVIQVVIESAAVLGLDDEAAFHAQRYRLAYPTEYARWTAAGGGASKPR
jgi:O-antigen polymerase